MIGHALRVAAAPRPAGRRVPRAAATRPRPLPAARRPARRQLAAAPRSFDGDAAKSLQEAAALDELIDVMLAAKSQQEVRPRGRRRGARGARGGRAACARARAPRAACVYAARSCAARAAAPAPA